MRIVVGEIFGEMGEGDRLPLVRSCEHSVDISWDIWETFWSLTKTNITEENQEILCHRENHEIYIGLARKRNYQEAFRICRSFGGHLPTPLR